MNTGNTFSNTTIPGGEGRAKTPSNFSNGGKGYSYITGHTGINNGLFSPKNDQEAHETYRNIQEFEQELLSGSKMGQAKDSFTPAMSTLRNPNHSGNASVVFGNSKKY